MSWHALLTHLAPTNLQTTFKNSRRKAVSAHGQGHPGSGPIPSFLATPTVGAKDGGWNWAAFDGPNLLLFVPLPCLPDFDLVCRLESCDLVLEILVLLLLLGQILLQLRVLD